MHTLFQLRLFYKVYLVFSHGLLVERRLMWFKEGKIKSKIKINQCDTIFLLYHTALAIHSSQFNIIPI